jgi:hypothetical protein
MTYTKLLSNFIDKILSIDICMFFFFFFFEKYCIYSKVLLVLSFFREMSIPFRKGICILMGMTNTKQNNDYSIIIAIQFQRVIPQTKWGKSTSSRFLTIFPIFREQNYFLLPYKKNPTIDSLTFSYIN